MTIVVILYDIHTLEFAVYNTCSAWFLDIRIYQLVS